MGHDAFTLVDVLPAGTLDERERISCLTYHGAMIATMRARRWPRLWRRRQCGGFYNARARVGVTR
jgi:hypothetical protein